MYDPRRAVLIAKLTLIVIAKENDKLKKKDHKQLNLSKMKVFLKPNSLVQFSCKSVCKQECY